MALSVEGVGVHLAGGTLYWLRCLETFTQFVAPNIADPTRFGFVVLIPVRDPFLRTTKVFEDSSIPIEEARRLVEDAPIEETVPSPKARSHPIKPKGKAVVESLENPKKKRKLVKGIEIEPKK